MDWTICLLPALHPYPKFSFGIQSQMTISLLLSPHLFHLSPALSTVLSSVSVSLFHTFLFFVPVSALRPLCQYAVSLPFWHFSFFFVITGFTVWKREKNSESGSKSHLVSTLLFFFFNLSISNQSLNIFTSVF